MFLRIQSGWWEAGWESSIRDLRRGSRSGQRGAQRERKRRKGVAWSPQYAHQTQEHAHAVCLPAPLLFFPLHTLSRITAVPFLYKGSVSIFFSLSHIIAFWLDCCLDSHLMEPDRVISWRHWTSTDDNGYCSMCLMYTSPYFSTIYLSL